MSQPGAANGEGQFSDPGLVAAALGGDSEALRAVWQQHRRWVAAVLLAHKPRSADLEDLLQEVAAIMVGKVGELRDEGAFKPWLRTVAISVARTAGRRSAVRTRQSWWRRVLDARGHSIGPDGAGPADADSSAGVEGLEEGRRLMRLASEMPEGYREPLLLKCVRGLSYRQIGELMGLPETTVETRIARARRMLRERAEDESDQDADRTTPGLPGGHAGAKVRLAAGESAGGEA